MVKTSRCWVLILGIVYTMQPGILHPTEQLGSMTPSSVLGVSWNYS